MIDVYKTYYHFKGNPFRLSPDYGFSFAHHSYANAKDFLKYGILQGEGFVAVTGSAGTGKTTLINQLMAEIDTKHITVAKLITVQLDPSNFLEIVAQAFGLCMTGGGEERPLLQLEQFLLQQDKRGRRTVLIVDEAQGLSPHSLEELRLLSNIQSDNRLLLHIILVGQEPLMEMIRAPGMEHLRQRFVAASHLEPLDLDETVAYVEHRLDNVGWKGDPTVSEAALQLVHQLSGGIPRRINLICHRLFLSGGLKRKHGFGSEDARCVIDELQKEGLLDDERSGEISIGEGVAVQSNEAATLIRGLPHPDDFARPEHPSHGDLRPSSKAHTPGVAAQVQSVSKKRADKGTSHSVVQRSQLPLPFTEPAASIPERVDVNSS